ncbi:PAS domain S-box protein [Roseateles sp. BYS87W]|uniref:histidine kinase n=1 Tax=Pelomonas baiyunensis TaxID=3299026 RepID=A0ABW7GWB0_9BURK
MTGRRPEGDFSTALRAALGVVVLTGLATAGAAAWQARHNQQAVREALQSRAQEATREIQARITRYDAGLRGLRGAVMAAGGRSLRSEQMHAYMLSRDAEREFPGARGLGVVWRVPQADETAFVARARAQGQPDYAVRQFRPHEGERKLVAFAEPLAQNQAAIGLDLASEPARDAATRQAARDGDSVLSEPLTLRIARDGGSSGLMLALPIYRFADPGATPEAREANTMGWTYAVLVARDVLADVGAAHGHVALDLFDLPQGGTGNPRQFIEHTHPGEGHDTEPATTDVEFDIRGRRWLARVHATQDFVAGLRLPPPEAAAASVGGVGLLLAGLTFFWVTARARAGRERLEQARRAAIVEGSDDAIIGATLDGVITEWNGGAERLFGYTATEALGQTVEALLLPPESLSDDLSFRATIARGQRVPPFDALRRHKDGHLIAVSLTAGPILDDQGRCVGMAKTLRDMRAAQQAREALAALNASLEAQVEQRTAELVAALRNNTALLQTLDRFALVAISDRDGRITQPNALFCERSGFSADELIGRTHPTLAAPEHTPAFWAELGQHLLQGDAWRGEICNLDKAGERYWLDSIVAPFLDAQGQIERFISISIDITPIRRLQHEAEQARKAAEDASRFLQEVTDRLPLRISYMDRDHRFRFVNAAQCEAYNLPREALLGQQPRAFVDGTPPPELAAAFHGALAGQSQIFETVIPSRHGELRDYEARLVPDLNAAGEVQGYYAVSTDISERKRAEQALERALTTLRAVLDAATQVSILSVDLNGRITLFNRGAEKLTGYTADEVMGRKAVELLHDPLELEERRAAMQAQLGESVGKNRVFVDDSVVGLPIEWSYCRKDGSRVPVSLAITHIRDDAGALVGLLGIAHDVSARQEFERTLREAIHRANHANQAKSQFLANMSHEIRTPMNAVIGLSYLLERTPLDGDQRGFVTKIQQASKSLLAIINDVLDLSKVEASEMSLEAAPFSLENLLDELAGMLGVQAQDKGIGFSIDRPRDLPEALEGDATRLRQVLTNLLSNAIKFTAQGEVRLQVQAQPLPAAGAANANDPARVALRFVVRDSGIGIAPDALGRIFQPFAQADTSTTRRYGGTGLGLSIVRQLVTLMGGTVAVTSQPGVGSEFTVDLTLRTASADALPLLHAAAPTTPAGLALQGVHVLVADDSELNLEVARRILRLEGATVSVAHDGQAAVQHLIDHPGQVDVVLMDVQMPVLDGHDATRRIRSALGLHTLPVIALTAGVTVGEQQRASAAGMNDVLGKPFDPQELVACLRRHLGERAPATAAPAAPSAEAPAAPPDRAAWLDIPGIDGPDARRRLGGDFTLFCTLLRRLLNDFADVPTAVPLDRDELPRWTRRMHNLKGSAGTLGARELARAAQVAETACGQRNLPEADASFGPLAAQLQALSAAAAPVLSTAEAPVSHSAEPLPAARLAHLLEQLDNGDLGALQLFAELGPALRQRLGAEAFAQVRDQMERLAFSAAAQALQPLLDPAHVPPPAG